MPGPGLPARDGLVKQRHHLIEHVDGRLRQEHQYERVPAVRIAAAKLRHRTPPPGIADAPPADSTDPTDGRPRHAETSTCAPRSSPPQPRPRRARAQPPQPGHPDLRVDLQHRVQPRTPRRRELTRQSVVRCPAPPGPAPWRPVPAASPGRPQHSRTDQMLTRQPKQQRRRILFHRPDQQKLIQFLKYQRSAVRHPAYDITSRR